MANQNGPGRLNSGYGYGGPAERGGGGYTEDAEANSEYAGTGELASSGNHSPVPTDSSSKSDTKPSDPTKPEAK